MKPATVLFKQTRKTLKNSKGLDLDNYKAYFRLQVKV